MARVDLRVAGYSNYAFSNTNPGDLIFRLQNTGAAVHFGDSSDAMPALTVNRDSIAFNASNVVFGGDSKLGIGTSNPGYPFEVVGDVNITGTIFNNGVPFQGGSAGGGESVWDNSNGNIFVVGSNVGIGTTQPIADLHVVGTTKLDGTVVLPSLLSFTGISISSGNDSNEIQYTKEWHESSNGGVFIMGSNVGIGVNEPAFPLDVAGDINLTGRIRQNGLPYVGSQWSNTEGGEVFLMGSNVGIGVSDPAYTLDVQGNARIGGLIVESNTLSLPGRLTFGGLKINQVDGIAGGSTNLSMTPQFIQSGCNLYLPSGCNLGLGVSNAVERLEVDGFISADGVKMAGTNYKLGLNVGGDKFDISYSNESLIDAKADIRYEISGTANNTPAILAQNTYGVVGELVRVNKNGDRFGLMPTYTGDVVRFANEHGSIDSNVTINTPTSSGFVITKRNSLGQLEWLWDAYPNISFSNCLYPGFGLGPIYCDNDGGVLSIIELTGGFDSTSRVVLTDVQNSQTTVEMIDNNFNFKSSQLLVHFDSDGRIINTCLFLDIDPVDFDKTFTQPKINGVVQLPNGNIIIASSYIKTIKTGTSLLTIDNMRSLTNIILGSNGSLTLWQTYSYNTELDQDTSDDVRIMLNYNCISLCDNGFVVLSPFEYSIDQNTSNVTKNINISDFNGNQRVFSFTESYNQCYGYILTKYDNNLNKLWESGYEVGIINFLGTYENEYPMISSIDGSITIHNSFEYQDDIAGPHDLNIYVNGVKTTYIIPDGTRGSTIVRFSSDGTFMWYYIPVVNHSNNYNYFARYYSIPASMMYKGDVFVFGRSIFYNEPSFIEHIGKNGKFIRFYDFAQIRGFAHANICDDDSLPLRLQILMYSFYIDFPSLTIGSYPPIKVTATQSQQLIELSLNLEERKFKTNSLNADTWIYGDVLNIADDSIQNTKIGISNALESVKHLEAFTYKRNDVLDGTTYIGFDSSNVQSFIPEVVREKGREKYISYNGILGVVTEAVKSLAGIVESNAATPGQWKNEGSNVFLMGSNVGVGVSNPMYSLDVGGVANFGNNIITQSILPASNLTYDIGTSNMRFRDLYLSGNTINLGGTKIGTDSNNNIRIADSTDTLKRIVVDEIQIGDDRTSNSVVRIKKESAGIKFYSVENNIEVDAYIGGNQGSITLSNMGVSNITPEFGYSSNLVTIPTVSIDTVPASANISYGRVTFGSHNGVSLANNGTTSLTIRHNLNTSNYFVYAMPELGSSIQVNISNYTLNAFTMTIKNVSGGNIANPVVNYQIVLATRNNSTEVIASPPNILVSSCNIVAYSSSNSSRKIFSMNQIALDPQGYPLTYTILNNTTGSIVSVSNVDTLIYNHTKTTGTNGSVNLLVKNPYVEDNTKVVTYNIVESNIDGLLDTLPSNINGSQTVNSSGQQGSSNLIASISGIPLIYTIVTSSNALGANIVNNNTINWLSAGISGSRQSLLTVKFPDNIMAEAALATKSLIFMINETLIFNIKLPNLKSRDVNGTTYYMSSSPIIASKGVISNTGRVYMWGWNGFGQLGEGTKTDRTLPYLIPNLSNISSIECGGNHTLALTTTGNVYAWGYNHFGQVGNGSNGGEITSITPYYISSLSNVISLSTGYYNSAALDSSGRVFTWGASYVTGGVSTNIPVQVSGLSNIVALSTGMYHHLALDSLGRIFAWGKNDKGQLGDGTFNDKNLPSLNTTLSNIVAIAAGGYHSLALTSFGQIYVWGWNQWGSVGSGAATNQGSPWYISSLSNINFIGAGVAESYVRTSSGNVYAWGANEGRFGNGSTTGSSSPQSISALSNYTIFSAQCLALNNSTGQVYSWGQNTNYQVGDGTSNLRTSPTLLNTSFS